MLTKRAIAIISVVAALSCVLGQNVHDGECRTDVEAVQSFDVDKVIKSQLFCLVEECLSNCSSSRSTSANGSRLSATTCTSSVIVSVVMLCTRRVRTVRLLLRTLRSRMANQELLSREGPFLQTQPLILWSEN